MGMRQLFTIAEFDRLVRQQAQRPPCTPSWRGLQANAVTFARC